MPAHDPDTHRRRSIRLPDYDYSAPGAYFITICTRKWNCLFGEVVDSEMHLTTAGRTVEPVWAALPQRFEEVELDSFVILPNHIHGIIWIVGAELAPPNSPTVGAGLALPDAPIVGAALAPPNDPIVAAGLAPPNELALPHPPTEQGAASRAPALSAIVGAFKSISAIAVNKVLSRKGPLWQRNYYEHVVRNEEDLRRIREYIVYNASKWDEDEYNPTRGVP